MNLDLASLPEGLEALEVRVPKPGEAIWTRGQIVYAKGISNPHLIVKVLDGYRLEYDMCRDCLAVRETPEPLPTPEKGDWLDVALEQTRKRLKRHRIATAYCPLETESVLLRQQLQQSGCDATIKRGSTRESLRETVEMMGANIARLILAHSNGEKVLTVDLPIPENVTEARRSVNNSVSMRYVLAMGDGVWLMRFDVLHGVIQGASKPKVSRAISSTVPTTS